MKTLSKICLSVLWLVIFIAVFALCSILLNFIVSLLLYIHLLKYVINFLLNSLRIGYEFALFYIASVIANFVVHLCADKVTRDDETYFGSFLLTGAYVIVIYLITAIINALQGVSIVGNVVAVLAGIIMVWLAKKKERI